MQRAAHAVPTRLSGGFRGGPPRSVPQGMPCKPLLASAHFAALAHPRPSHQVLYPVNSLRNYARLMADTDLIANIDVDMIPAASFSAALAQPQLLVTYTQAGPAAAAPSAPARARSSVRASTLIAAAARGAGGAAGADRAERDAELCRAVPCCDHAWSDAPDLAAAAQGCRSGGVYVLPAFEAHCGGGAYTDTLAVEGRAAVPAALKKCLRRMRPNAPASHNATNYERWLAGATAAGVALLSGCAGRGWPMPKA